MSAIMGHEGSVKPVFPCKNQEAMNIYCVCTHMYRYTCMKLWMESTTDVSQKPLANDFCEKNLSLGHGTHCFPVCCFLCSFKEREQSPLLVWDEKQREVLDSNVVCSLLKNPKRKASVFLYVVPLHLPSLVKPVSFSVS